MTARPSGSRRRARQRAVEILYEADVRDRPLPELLADYVRAERAGEEGAAMEEFTLELVRGVHRHREELDGLISAYARDWRLERMPIVDRNLLRLGLFEILYVDDVPTAVAIDEAVELAKRLSTDDSGRFINGVLARIAEARAGN